MKKKINGLLKTREQTVIENMGMVRKIAYKYLSRARAAGIEFEDLENIGAIGLLKAFDDFDDSRGFRFSTYAYPKIIVEMQRAIFKGADKDIHYPMHVKLNANKLLEFEWEQMSIKELSEKTSISQSRILAAIEYLTAETIRLEKRVENTKRSERTDYHEFVGEYPDISIIYVSDFLTQLSDIECEIVKRVMKGESQRSICHSWGVSHSYVWNYLKVIRLKLQKYLDGQKIEKLSS